MAMQTGIIVGCLRRRKEEQRLGARPRRREVIGRLRSELRRGSLSAMGGAEASDHRDSES
eukprot:3231517-Rhodomonas_salina.2